jgi:hypothetical protein
MPKDYIVRLVFDRRHISLAILRLGRIIGGAVGAANIARNRTALHCTVNSISTSVTFSPAPQSSYMPYLILSYSLVVCFVGVCYRPYMEQRFGEIAFCAISGSEQVKGYGTLLLNHLKTHVQKDSKSCRDRILV